MGSAKVRPTLRKEFKPCDPYWIRKEFKWLINDPTTTKKQQENFVRGLISSCAKGAVKGAREPRPKRAMNSWNCYLKQCAAKSDLSFQQCMKDTSRKESEYIPKKDYWKKIAEKGCPI